MLVLPEHLQLLHHTNTQHAKMQSKHTHTQNTCHDRVSQCSIILHPLSTYVRSTEQKKAYDLPSLMNAT